MSRERVKRWNLKNPEKAKKAARAQKAARALRGHKYSKQYELDKLHEELKSKPCTDCGNTFPTCCMDHDHKPGTEKLYCVGAMFAHHYSKELILAEVAKCELVCSNCHRIRTRDRRIAKYAAIRESGIRALAKNTSASK